MRLAFHAPYKPLDHPRLSGDVTIARDLVGFLANRGHQVTVMDSPSSRYIWRLPGLWPRLALAAGRALRVAGFLDLEAWLTYHSYYRSPDLLGPLCRRRRRPYFIFAPAYSSKRRRSLSTWPGYQLNRLALARADHIFTNKRRDLANLARVVPAPRLTYVRPGIVTADYRPDPAARERLRAAWGVGPDDPVVLAVAMFRPGVKLEGLTWVIRACARLVSRFPGLRLVLVGDGPGGPELGALADRELGGRVIFAGRMERAAMSAPYSAADIYAFPGISEGLGMAYLEAQCCGLPCVAWDHDGAPDVVAHGQTGFITPSHDLEAFAGALDRLAGDAGLRRALGEAGRRRVRALHDLDTNYRHMEAIMLELVARRRRN